MTKKITGVLLPVLIQDPAVAGETRARSIVHPVIVRDPGGFVEGPACRRVAVVDLDFQTGRLRRPLPFEPTITVWKGFSHYRVALPRSRGKVLQPWGRSKERGVELSQLAVSNNDALLKVSVFGTVLRTLVLIQNPAVLGREISWAFPGKQLLVVPQAGELDNAFYHRDSRSLQFYYGKSAAGTVWSGLSQDIVAHEATHAIVDGLAPDLYDAVSPESLAIHEGLADLTAAMLTMRNRELAHSRDNRIDDSWVEGSSRFSQIAEEFGRWRGHGNALRDIHNRTTLRAVDDSSPHSTSQVLSGLMFEVFSALYAEALTDPAATRKLHAKQDSAGPEALRYRIAYATDRTLGMCFRGLDWLPPGDASFSDLLAAMLVADELYVPDRERARRTLRRQAARRGIGVPDPINLGENVVVPATAAARRALGDSYRSVLEIPEAARVTLTVRPTHIYRPPLLPKSNAEVFDLKPDMSPFDRTLHHVIKFAWWQREPNDLGARWGRQRRYRTGATLVVDGDGRIVAALRNSHGGAAAGSRSRFLRRMIASSTGSVGPDGTPLLGGLRATLDGDTLSISGALQALHVAEVE